MLRYQNGYPRPSLATPPYRPSLPQIFRATSRIYTALLYASSSWSPCLSRPFEGVHKSISLMSSSLLLQQCPASLARLILIVFVLGGRWSYSCCFVECFPPGLFQYCFQHSCVVTVKRFLHPFS